MSKRVTDDEIINSIESKKQKITSISDNNNNNLNKDTEIQIVDKIPKDNIENSDKLNDKDNNIKDDINKIVANNSNEKTNTIDNNNNNKVTDHDVIDPVLGGSEINKTDGNDDKKGKEDKEDKDEENKEDKDEENKNNKEGKVDEDKDDKEDKDNQHNTTTTNDNKEEVATDLSKPANHPDSNSSLTLSDSSKSKLTTKLDASETPIKITSTDPEVISRIKKLNHKEVERRRRETINNAIRELQDLVPTTHTNKAQIIRKASEFIKKLKEKEETLVSKWTLEKIITEQAISELANSNEKLKSELEKAYREIEHRKNVFENFIELVSKQSNSDEINDFLSKVNTLFIDDEDADDNVIDDKLIHQNESINHHESNDNKEEESKEDNEIKESKENTESKEISDDKEAENERKEGKEKEEDAAISNQTHEEKDKPIEI